MRAFLVKVRRGVARIEIDYYISLIKNYYPRICFVWPSIMFLRRL